MELVIDCLNKERPKAVCLSLVPWEDGFERKYSNESQIDEALYKRYSGRKHWKVGSTERIVYEKVAGLKRPSVLQSVLYNFSSEGGLGRSDVPIHLVGATPKQLGCVPDACVSNIRAQILVD